MAARRRTLKTKDLPPNLYVRGGYFSYRDPRTGKEYGLGRDKRCAVNQAVEANMSLIPSPASLSLLDRMNGKEVVLFDELITQFRQELTRRGLRTKTLTDYESKLKTIQHYFEGIPAETITTKDICAFLETKVAEGKKNMANRLRNTLSDIYKTAIARGLVQSNPVLSTKTVRTEVNRERLTLEEYLKIREAVQGLKNQAGLSFDLAVVTGQRESDLVKMKWDDIRDGRLYIVQQKTGVMLAISLSTGITQLDITVCAVLDALKTLNGHCSFVLGGLSGATLSGWFKKARAFSGLTWASSPPTFHELRSLSGRLYSKERGKDFAQDILGHKTSAMTDKYRDGRGKEWKEV